MSLSLPLPLLLIFTAKGRFLNLNKKNTAAPYVMAA